MLVTISAQRIIPMHELMHHDCYTALLPSPDRMTSSTQAAVTLPIRAAPPTSEPRHRGWASKHHGGMAPSRPRLFASLLAAVDENERAAK